MAGDVTKYTDLITSEHFDKPKFMATVQGLCQPLADLYAQLELIPKLYDLDTAVGQQLDVVGQWVGVSRTLVTPLTGVYFSFDEAGVGFNQGIWLGPFDPVTGLTQLPDDMYRLLLYARIAANYWDGTPPGAYDVWATIFEPLGMEIAIIDHQDMSMDLVVLNKVPDAVTLALLTEGYLNLKPLGVRINEYVVPSVDGPLFGFNILNDNISGFNLGGWAEFIPA